jgi:cytochrome c oxidase cbb3-type subunit 3
MNRKKPLVWMGVFFIALIIIAPHALVPVRAVAQETRIDPMLAENVQRGSKTYTANCSFCHGPSAKGSSNGPSLIDSSVVRHDKEGDLIGKIVHEGRVDKGMPSFSALDGNRIADLAAFLHARVQATDSRETAGPRSGYDLKRLLTGDAVAGKAYFNSTGGCSKCHSVTQDLAGVATKYQPSQLENRMLYPRGMSPHASVTRDGGLKMEGTLVHIDPFYVAIVDVDGQYRSWDRTTVKVEVNDPLGAHLTLLGKYTNKDVHDLFAYLETLK